MGKWTASHYDDVLNAKIKSLVSGAITRSRLEKTDPLITYETFVEELDAGDSFTTSVVDILVKELAERRTRSSMNDRRLIADRTAKNLHSLATSARIYRGRRHFGRRLGATDHLISPPGETGMEDDDEEFESLLTSHEGVRVNNDLYEAYSGGSTWANALFHRRDSTSEERSSPPPQPPSPPPTSLARILAATSSPSNISRQPSIRRPQRSRTVDFNDFSSRRRSMYREAATEENRTSGQPGNQRRFFHFPRHHHRFDGSSSSWTSPWIEDDDHETRAYPTVEPSPSSAAWFFPHPGPLTPTLSHDSTDTETPEERPRLRRGGVRAPESMLSRHASPIPEQQPVVLQVLQPDRSTTVSTEPSAYPTPGPAENENS